MDHQNNKKILITGGAGYLGSVLVGEALRKGYKVRVLDFLLFGGESLLGFYHHPNFEFIKGDIRNKKIVEESMNGVYAVCHHAALVGDIACKVNPKKTEEINLLATSKLIASAKKAGVKRFIFTSTCSNYGVTNSEEEADENYPLNPLSLYAETKVKAEKIIRKSLDKNFSPIILRLATLFGISPKMRFNLLINECVREAYSNNKLNIYKPQAWRPYLHVKDAARAVLTVLEANKALVAGETFNVVGENKRKSEILTLISQYFPKVNVEIKEGQGTDLRDYKVSGGKIKKRIKFSPEITINESIREMKKSLDEGYFSNPYDDKYTMWIKESLL